MPVTVEKVPRLPLEWLRECSKLQEFASGALVEILLTHGHNMEDAGKCRARHNALVKRLKELQE